jgi:hypothetical protein
MKLAMASIAAIASTLVLAGTGAAHADAGAPLGPPQAPFGEWTALGSGCRGGSGGGDVVAEVLPGGSASSWRVRFHLDSFHLSTDERAPDAPLTFARECGMRIVLKPPRGQRVALVAAETRLAARKSDGAKLTLAAGLRVGPTSVAERSVTYDAPGDRSEDERITLAPGVPEPMPTLACGESRIAALDLTWIVTRTAASQSAHVATVGERTADVIVRFEPC